MKLRKALPGAVAAAVFVSGMAHAQPCPGDTVTVGGEYHNGASFNEMSEGVFGMYFLGVLDGLTISPIAGAEKSCIDHTIGCTESLVSTQLMAIAKKYLRENPQMWDVHCALSIYNALREFCQSRLP